MAYTDTTPFMYGNAAVNAYKELVGAFCSPDEDHVPASQPAFIDTKYVGELNAEKQSLNQATQPHSLRLVSHGAFLNVHCKLQVNGEISSYNKSPAWNWRFRNIFCVIYSRTMFHKVYPVRFQL